MIGRASVCPQSWRVDEGHGASWFRVPWGPLASSVPAGSCGGAGAAPPLPSGLVGRGLAETRGMT